MTQKHHMLARAALLAMLASVALAAPAEANKPAKLSDEALVEGALLCTQHFPVQEKRNNIPTHLLAAIATTESGRWHDGLDMNVPWPWTINVEGKGYFFNSKAEAIAQTQNLIARGARSIDVGCMQVNLKHHPKAFADLNEAFDPQKNVTYAAKFLRDNYASLGDWIKATAAYHSRTPKHGQRYLGQIERSWNRIVAKVAAARATKGGNPNAAATHVALAGDALARPAVKAVAKPRIVQTTRTTRPPRSARVIEVSDNARRNGEVVVVRPEPAPVVAVAEPVALPAAPRGNSIRRVSLDNTPPAALPVPQANQPDFVFAN
jgi:hypothetical protein